jgi:hypothetical protein
MEPSVGMALTVQTKFTTAVFYSWMQSDIAGLYYQVLSLRLRHRA